MHYTWVGSSKFLISPYSCAIWPKHYFFKIILKIGIFYLLFLSERWTMNICSNFDNIRADSKVSDSCFGQYCILENLHLRGPIYIQVKPVSGPGSCRTSQTSTVSWLHRCFPVAPTLCLLIPASLLLYCCYSSCYCRSILLLLCLLLLLLLLFPAFPILLLSCMILCLSTSICGSYNLSAWWVWW